MVSAFSKEKLPMKTLLLSNTLPRVFSINSFSVTSKNEQLQKSIPSMSKKYFSDTLNSSWLLLQPRALSSNAFVLLNNISFSEAFARNLFNKSEREFCSERSFFTCFSNKEEAPATESLNSSSATRDSLDLKKSRLSSK